MKNPRSFTTKDLTLCALLLATTCFATLLLKVPVPPFGYINLGDCIILLGAWLCGPLAISAAVGAMLADILSGYAIYAPATLLVKTIVALVAWKILQSSHVPSLSTFIISAFLAEFFMVAGYYFYDAILLHSFLAALPGVLFNVIQAATNILIASIIGPKILHLKDRYTKE